VTAWYLLATLGLLLANGFFVGAEFAVTAARRSRIEELAAEGDLPAVLTLRSIRELSLMLAGAQLGITIASLLLGFISEPAIASLIVGPLHTVAAVPVGVAHTIAFLIALLVVVFLHMVIGEMAPKNIAIADPEKSALWVAVPFRGFVNLFRPFLLLLNLIANALLRLGGIEPHDQLEESHSTEDIAAMITESARQGALGKFEQRLLTGAIGFGERDAADVMVPRTEMVALPVSSSSADLERAILETGHSRFPIYGGDLDHVLGFVHAKDLLDVAEDERAKPIARRLIRPMLVVPETRKLHPLLFDMRGQRRHFGLVVDEHGGTSGIVTIEDLLEELVGEIRDEYDFAEAGIEQLGNDRYAVPGTLRIDEVADYLGLELPEGDYETVAGFLMDRLGRIPTRDDAVEHAGWRLKVQSMQRRRIVQVLLEKLATR
jgi:CBS domain containing-hemolysin-like protein